MRLIIMLVMSIFLSAPQATTLKLHKKIPIKGKKLNTDLLGNTYIESNRKVFKYDYNGNFINNYSNNNYGEISSIDATNPYKLLVFYQRFGKMVFLDNMLSENGSTIDLIDTDYNQASLVCHSFDNGYWIYEPLLNELFKLDQNLQLIQQTGNLSRILSKDLKPDFLIEFNNRVYLNNPSSGILVFDQYGTYVKTIPIKQTHSFQVRADRIHYIRDNQLLTYYFGTLETDTTNLPVQEDLIGVQVQKKRMFVLTSNALQIFDL